MSVEIKNKKNTIEQSEIIELVVASQNGDRLAFGELVKRYQGHVLAVAMRRLRNFNDAQELVQEVFIKAMDKIDQLRQPACFGGWLRSITHRLAINLQIRQSRGFSIEPDRLASACIDDSAPENQLIESERDAQLKEGMDNLREMDRQALHAFYLQGQSLSEMSHEFDAPLGTIKRRLHVARKRLARELVDLVV